MLACWMLMACMISSRWVSNPSICWRIISDVKSSPRSRRRASMCSSMNDQAAATASIESCSRALSQVRMGERMLSESKAILGARLLGAEIRWQ